MLVEPKAQACMMLLSQLFQIASEVLELMAL